jgi:hypothetical protein
MHRVHQAVRDVCDVCPTGLRPSLKCMSCMRIEALGCKTMQAAGRLPFGAWLDLHADHCVVL